MSVKERIAKIEAGVHEEFPQSSSNLIDSQRISALTRVLVASGIITYDEYEEAYLGCLENLEKIIDKRGDK